MLLMDDHIKSVDQQLDRGPGRQPIRCAHNRRSQTGSEDVPPAAVPSRAHSSLPRRRGRFSGLSPLSLAFLLSAGRRATGPARSEASGCRQRYPSEPETPRHPQARNAAMCSAAFPRGLHGLLDWAPSTAARLHSCQNPKEPWPRSQFFTRCGVHPIKSDRPISFRAETCARSIKNT